MPLQLSWQLLPKPHASNLPGFWLQLVEAAEYAGLDALFLPSDACLPEPLTLTAALAARTPRLRLVVGVRIDIFLPAALAGSAQSLQAICGNRLQLYLQGAAGPRLTGDQHLAQQHEFVQLLARLLQHRGGEAVHHQGEHFHLEHAELGLRDIPPAPL
jgi:alkanesulfonate monooxygenase